MSFVVRELLKIRLALPLTDGEKKHELYAAQQALEWALEPSGIRSPYQMIMGIPEGSEGCPSESNPALSLCASAEAA